MLHADIFIIYAAADLEYAASANWLNCLHNSSGSQSYAVLSCAANL